MKKIIILLSGLLFAFVLLNNTSVAKANDNVSFKSGKGFILQTDDGNNKLETRIRLQMLSDTTFEEKGDVSSKFLMRRARIVFKGHYVNTNNVFKLELAISPKDMGIKDGNSPVHTPILDFYLGFTQLKSLSARVGQMKTLLSRERVVSSGNLSLVDRSIVNKEFTTDRDTGIMLYSKNLFGSNIMKYYLGVYSGLGRNVVDDHYGDLLYMGRIEFLPLGLFKDDYSYTDFNRYNVPKISIGFAYGFLDSAKKDKGIIGSVFENDFTLDYHFTSADFILKFRGLNIHSEIIARNSNSNLGRNGYGIFEQVGYLLPGALNTELVARHSSNRPFEKSSLTELNELIGGVNFYFNQHPFKIQMDAGQLWSNEFKTGDKKLRIQLQGSF